MFDLMTWRVLVVGLMLPWLGFLFGCVISLLLRQPRANVIAIAIETGVQNSGIAIVLLKVISMFSSGVIGYELTVCKLLLGIFCTSRRRYGIGDTCDRVNIHSSPAVAHFWLYVWPKVSQW